MNHHPLSWRHCIQHSMAALLVVMYLLGATPAQSQTTPAPTTPSVAGVTPSASGGASSDVCTNFAQRKAEVFGGTASAPAAGASQGLLSDIYLFIKEVVGDATENLFSAFVEDSRYQNAVGAVFILVVIFFGVAFTMGLLQLSYSQVLMRLIKMGIVMTLISPGGWSFFSATVVTFFNDGTDDLVKTVITIGTGVPTPPGSTPFYQFDKMAQFIINPEMISALMGILSSGPYGIAMAGLTMIGFIGFVKLLIDALRMYAVAFVARSMLLGLAPVFFTFMLFEKTKQLFMTWVNALVGFSLQPILMFTFLSFFMVLLETASTDMLSTEFCWTDCQIVQGSTNPVRCFRQQDPTTGNVVRSNASWNGSISCLLQNTGVTTGSSAACPESPLNIINVLTFLILVYIATSFAEKINDIANELSNSFIGLDTGGKIGQALSSGASNIANNITGGSRPPNRPR